MASNNGQTPGTTFPVMPLSIPKDIAQNEAALSSSLPSSSSSTTTISKPGVPGTPKSIYEMIMSNPPPTSANYTPQAAMHRPVEYYSETNRVDRGRGYNKDYALDKLTRKSLPYFMPWKTSGGPTEIPPNYAWLMDGCAGKAAIGVFGGGVMGLLMGVFLGALSDSQPPIQVAGGKDVPQAPFKEQARYTMRATAEKSMYWCRNFAFITGVFGGSECLVEKFRGKHDMWNPVVSGCITGAALQAHAGPQAAAVGCGGFAAFSIVIDKIMGNYD
ncbi:unnamed protein product [Pseudo-nitzschia multistriata]|uniref:Mitochondrial import inner membrane translocase subunit TIM22 n=1 Tax=Pseudo-nitzschia multistriata TaxID=183589 RepID=A0A448Z601_9STRA|nr:unnamed protein product [Pseudo-nitzschia multistriata]